MYMVAGAMMGTVITPLAFALHWTIVVVLTLRILMRRRPRGSSLAWITLTLALPYVGAALYLIVGEVWLPRSRARHVAQLIHAERAARSDLQRHPPRVVGLDPELLRVLGTLAEHISGIGMIAGNGLELLDGSASSFRSMIRDIENAASTCYILTYIWQPAERTDEVASALIRAAERGVDCRVLVDAYGSTAFLGSGVHHRLCRAGVKVEAANDSNWIRTRLSRIDLRNHRKLVVIDGAVGYIGSLNIIDPATFRARAGVGKWVDCMVRLDGPGARDLERVFLRDWSLERPESAPPDHRARCSDNTRTGGAVVQVLPSGPAQDPQVLRQMVLSLIYSARREIIITTPYFVPDESMMVALTSASRSGVAVRIIVPARSDAVLVQFATRAYFHDLLAAGVQIHLFTDGLLHSKIITVDGAVGLLGTANMDLRSFELNLEVSLLVYDIPFTELLAGLQRSYINRSESLDRSAWSQRSRGRALLDNVAQLVAPIL